MKKNHHRSLIVALARDQSRGGIEHGGERYKLGEIFDP